MKKKTSALWGIISGLLIAGYAVFLLLDAFVIPRDIVKVEDIAPDNSLSYTSKVESDVSSAESAVSGAESSDVPDASDTSSDQSGDTVNEPVITENSYTDENISITITSDRRYDTDIYIADIIVKDPSYLKAGLAEGSFGRNVKQKTSEMAVEYGAVLAINGDYYGYRDRGYVMRNGYLYRDKARHDEIDDALAVYADGSMSVVKESEVSAEELKDSGAVQIFSFGPGLLSDGKFTVESGDEVKQSMNSNPRTAIGMVEPLHYVFVVSDGRTSQNIGLSLYELAWVMKDAGCTLAYNLDGGGSSTMWFCGRIVNNPTSHTYQPDERSVSDIVYIG